MTEEEKKAKRREYNKKWREAHPGYNREYMRKYVSNNREAWNEYCMNFQRKHKEAQQKRMNDYHATPRGRAYNLYAAYVGYDVKYFGVTPDITPEFIVEKCFSENSVCNYCGCSDWKLLGLDRISNNRPHNQSNVICSCRKCNTSRHSKKVDEWLKIKGIEFDDWGEESNGITIQYPEK